MYTFLDDTRQLHDRGDHQAALELVDLWLDEHPGDAEARLLKAEICLSGGKNFAYVGQVLLDFAGSSASPLAALRRQSAELAWSLIAVPCVIRPVSPAKRLICPNAPVMTVH